MKWFLYGRDLRHERVFKIDFHDFLRKNFVLKFLRQKGARNGPKMKFLKFYRK